MFVITSLLTLISLHVILCIRIFLNFVMLTYYISHDELILNYMKHALMYIKKWRKIFRKYRERKTKKSQNVKRKKKKKDHFNFLKFYILVHWVNHIKKYNNLVEYDNFAKENMYKKIKSQYERTNQRKNSQKEIL